MAHKPRTFRVFVSSTFSDMVVERNALQERVFPHLQEFCRQREARFQAVDLRWGVSEEAGRDQQTMNICLEELRRCQDTTPRPNFIVLLAQRYGWRPLPPQINAQEFDRILAVLAPQKREDLRRWYKRDDNAVPPEYCLQPRKDDFENHERWSDEETVLRGLLLQGMEQVLPQDDPGRVKYEASATHQEILEGALNATHREQQVFAYLRTIDGLPRDARASRILDLNAQGRPDADAEQRLEQLKDELRRALPARQVYEYAAQYSNQGLTDDHLAAFCERVERDLREVIEAELQTLEQNSALAQEVDAHLAFGKERSETFLGRDDLLQRIAAYLDGAEPRPLVLHGLSGAGKTALMSKAVLERLNAPGHEQAIYRFLGATPASSDLRSLLDGLCRQIAEQYQDDRPLPQEMHELVKDLPERMAQATANRPLTLFLDALDQLSANDSAHALYWLPRELPAHVRLVVSVLEGEGPAGECSRVARSIFPEACHVAVGPLSAEAGAALLDAWLSKAKRTLTAEQRHEILTQFAPCPRPLYLKLAFEEARRWKSYDGLPWIADIFPGLNGNISSVLNDLFARLEQPSHHGPMLVQRALGYLAAARNGLTEEELLGVLSADAEFMADFIDRSPTERAKRERGEKVLDRLPIIIWSRLYHDLKPYLTERRADRTSLFSFYHHTVSEAVAARYLEIDDKLHCHQGLARYFGSLPNRLSAGNKEPNCRKTSELPYQQTQGEMWGELEQTLSREDALPFMEAKTEAGEVFDLALDYVEAIKRLPDKRPGNRILRLLEEAIRREIHFISRHAHDYPQGLFQCLWNSCWWYDCPAAAEHYDLTTFSGRLPWEQPGAKLHELLTSWREAKERSTPGFSWLRSLRPPPELLGSSQRSVLGGHENDVTCVGYSPGGAWIVSGSRDGTVRVWDARSNQQVDIAMPFGQFVNFVAMAPDARTLAMASFQEIQLCHVEGEKLSLAGRFRSPTLFDCFAVGPRGHTCVVGIPTGQVQLLTPAGTDEVQCAVLGRHASQVANLVFAPTGHWAASTGRDKCIRIWNLDERRQEFCLRRHHGWTSCAAFSVDGKLLASGGSYGEIRLWDLASQQAISLLRGHKGRITVLAFSPDSALLASGGKDSTVRIWEVATGKERCCLTGHHEEITALAFGPDGDSIVSGSQDATVRTWRLGNSNGNPATRRQFDSSGVVLAIAMSAAGDRAATGHVNGDLCIWDMSRGRLLTRVQAHTGVVKCLAFSPDGDRLVSGGRPRTLFAEHEDGPDRLYRKGKIRWFDGEYEHRDKLSSYHDYSDATGDHSLCLWDVQSGKHLRSWPGHELGVREVHWDRSGRIVISLGYNDEVLGWHCDREGTQASPDVFEIVHADVADNQPAYGVILGPLETVFEETRDSKPVALWPDRLLHVIPHPDGCTWVGSTGAHVRMVRLESLNGVEGKNS